MTVHFDVVLAGGFPIAFDKIDLSCNCAAVVPNKGVLKPGEPQRFTATFRPGIYTRTPDATGAYYFGTSDGRHVAVIQFKLRNDYLMAFGSESTSVEVPVGQQEALVAVPLKLGTKVPLKDLFFETASGQCDVESLSREVVTLKLRFNTPIEDEKRLNVRVRDANGRTSETFLNFSPVRSVRLFPKIHRLIDDRMATGLCGRLYVSVLDSDSEPPIIGIDGPSNVEVAEVRSIANGKFEVTLKENSNGDRHEWHCLMFSSCLGGFQAATPLAASAWYMARGFAIRASTFGRRLFTRGSYRFGRCPMITSPGAV